MQALVLNNSDPQYRTDYPQPQIPTGEALIRPRSLGVCSTDIELCRGYMGFNGVLGHEFVGVVEQVYEGAGDADQRWVGKRVVGGINCVCGKCDMCQRGLSTHCRDRTVLGIQNRDGCFAEYFTLPIANLLEVPDHVDDDHAVFTEPVAAACQALAQLHIESKPYITVLGDGRLGLLTAQVLARANASVRVVGKHEKKMELCEKWSIKHRPLNEISPRADQDIVVDCTGSASGFELAMQMVRPRGTIMLKTTVADAPAVNLAPIVINEIQIVGSRCGNFRDAMQLLSADEIDVVSLISRRMNLANGVEALSAAKQSQNIKVLMQI